MLCGKIRFRQHKARTSNPILTQEIQQDATVCQNFILYLRPTNLHICKTRGCWCSFRLVMMGGVSPETCSASYKYKIKFWYIVANCWIFYVSYTMMHGSTNLKSNSALGGSDVVACFQFTLVWPNLYFNLL
jgi:hypothetical protein